MIRCGAAGSNDCPQPDDGDVFLDFEGHPFWRPDAGLFFLFGLLSATTTAPGATAAWWAHDRDEEAARRRPLIDYLAAAARAVLRACTSTTTTTPSGRRCERLTAEHGVGRLS